MKDSCSRGILFGRKFLISTRYPVNTTPRLPRGRDCVGGVLARATGARLRELPSTHTGVEVLHLTLRELPAAAPQQDKATTPEESLSRPPHPPIKHLTIPPTPKYLLSYLLSIYLK